MFPSNSDPNKDNEDVLVKVLRYFDKVNEHNHPSLPPDTIGISLFLQPVINLEYNIDILSEVYLRDDVYEKKLKMHGPLQAAFSFSAHGKALIYECEAGGYEDWFPAGIIINELGVVDDIENLEKDQIGFATIDKGGLIAKLGLPPRIARDILDCSSVIKQNFFEFNDNTALHAADPDFFENTTWSLELRVVPQRHMTPRGYVGLSIKSLRIA